MSSKKRKSSELSSEWIEIASKRHPERTFFYNKVTKETTWKKETKIIPESKILGKHSQPELHTSSSKKRLVINTFEADKIEKSGSQVVNDGRIIGNKTEISTPKEVVVPVTKTKKKKKRNKKKHENNLSSNLSSNFNTPTQSNDSINVRLQGAAAPKPVANQGKKDDLNSVKTCQKPITVTEDGDKNATKTKNDNISVSCPAQDRLVKFQLKHKEKQLAIFQNMFRYSKLINKKLDEVDNTSKEKQENIASNKKRKSSEACASSTESITTLGSPVKVKNIVIKHVREDKKFQQTLRHLLTQSKDDVNKELLDDDNSMVIDEEMDWEPSEQEVMIEHIKSMRENMNAIDDISSEFTAFSKDGQKNLENNNLILVFDTNVFISCLQFIKGIQETFVPGLGLPTLYIPWRVLHELDHLKNSVNSQLRLSARKAISYINDNFSSRHHRITGQSFEEYMSMRTGEELLPDDEILKICLNLRMTENQRSVILITNDKNLESKAIVSKVEAYSKNRFMEEKLGQTNVKNSVEAVNLPSKKPDRAESDSFAKLKYLLKNMLEEILKTELTNAFGEDWSKIVTRKPPWTLNDIFECFVKHWRSVFTFVFRKEVLKFVEDMKNFFREADKSNPSISEAVEISTDLLVTMKNNIIPERSLYGEKFRETISSVGTLNKIKEKPNPITLDPRHEKDFSQSSSHMCMSESSNRAQNIIMDSPMFDEQQCREKVKALFQAVWESVKNYCCRICEINELVSTGGMNSSDIDQVKCQYPNVMRALEELIQFVEKIVCLEPVEIAQSYQLIQDFTNLLVNLNVFQVEASEMNDLSRYIGFFCCDNDSRAILRILVNDLRQFAWQIMNSVKVLGFV